MNSNSSASEGEIRDSTKAMPQYLSRASKVDSRRPHSSAHRYSAHNDRNQRDRSRSRSPYRHPRSPPPTSRKRSRSPYRASHDKKPRRDQNARSYQQDGRHHRDDGRFPQSKSKSGRDLNPRKQISYSDIDTQPNNHEHPVTHSRGYSRNHEENDAGSQGYGMKFPTSQTLAPVENHPSEVSEDIVMTTVEPELGEAELEALRAEKRRRRQEIRARQAASESENPPQPLLQQALVGSISESSTPNIASPAMFSENSVSPPLASPSTPSVESFPVSPAAVSIDGELGSLNQGNDGADGPPVNETSAAEYDPTKDMEEDQLRANLKLQQSELPSAAYDETKTEPVRTKPTPPKKIEKDMFADDFDDDDETSDNDTHAEGRRLDEGLLDNWDDKNGYLIIYKDELVNNGRFQLHYQLGNGMYANVVRATDKSSKQAVAIKIVRKNDAMKKAGRKEIEYLKRLNDADPDDKRHVIRFLHHFDHKQHLCMVFENLDKNLRDLLRDNGSSGLAFKAVTTYASQILRGLYHLKSCHIIHADLKPDNILVSQDRKTVKICDLGTAVDDRDNNDPTEYLVSRFYRAPDIILGFKVDHGIDMWSIGCTLFELWTGNILFTGKTNNQVLKSIIDCRGMFTEKHINKAPWTVTSKHFTADPHFQFKSYEENALTRQITMRLYSPRKPVRDLKSKVHAGATGIVNGAPTTAELNLFTDLLERCLNVNAEKRITPQEALKHGVFTPQSQKAATAPRHLPTKSTVFRPPTNRNVMGKRGAVPRPFNG